MGQMMLRWIVLIVILVGGFMFFKNVSVPELGVTEGKFQPLSSRPNSVSTQTAVKSKKVFPLIYSGNLNEEMSRIVAILEAMPGAKVHKKEGAYLHAIFTTSLMRYKDDVEIYIDEKAKEVHFRSASRVGYSDMGVNRKRYDAFALKYLAD